MPVGLRDAALTDSLKVSIRVLLVRSRMKLISAGGMMSSPNSCTLKPKGMLELGTIASLTMSCTKPDVNER